MTRRWLPRGTIAAVSALVVIVALSSRAPLSAREEHVARLAAAAGATSPDGPARPLLIQANGELWLQPLAVYPAAALLKSGWSREAAVRLPAAVAGVLTAALTYLLTKRVMGTRVAMLAATFLLMVPAYLVHTRTAGADLMMMPPVLLWLLCVLEQIERPRRWVPIAAGAALSIALYTQPAGVLAVPVYFVIGSIVWLRAAMWGQAVRTVAYVRESSDVRNSTHGLIPTLAAAAAGVALGSLPLVIWFLQHPASYPDTFGRWAVHLAHVRNPLEGLAAFTHWDVMSRRAGAYWDYLNPTFLFVRGEVFNPLLGLLIPIGLWVSWHGMALAARSAPPSAFERRCIPPGGVVPPSNIPDILGRRALPAGRLAVLDATMELHHGLLGPRLILTSFVVAPAAAVLLDEPRHAALALPLAVFGAVLAALGAETLVRRLVHVLNSRRSRYERP